MNTETTPTDRLERKISSRFRASILGPQQEIGNSVFAINWFNTRLAWLYHLYNWLAANRVHEVGGNVFFKGKVIRHVSGSPDMGRQFLLIVNYPSGNAFLELLSNRKFQFTSILRVLAVKQFSFVFQKRIDGSPPAAISSAKSAPNRSYAMLHIQDASASDVNEAHRELYNLATEFLCQIDFLGHQCGQLLLTKGDRNPEPIDFVTGTTLIVSAADQTCLYRLLESKRFGDLVGQFKSHYAAAIRRLI